MLTRTIRILLSAGCLASICLTAGAAFGAESNNFARTDASPKKDNPDKKVLAPPAAAPSIAEFVQTLTPNERITQLMLVTVLGRNAPNSEDMMFLSRYAPGGVIIPATLRPSSAAGYVTALRRLPVEKRRGIPLFIATNLYSLEQPGATAFFSQLPSMLSIAAANDPDTTERLGTFVAGYLNAMGFNMHLGPSLELAPILPGAKGSLQSFGGNPEFAATAGSAMIRGLTENGIVVVAMGFPGGGANRLPKQPAVLMTPKAALAEKDLLPYARAISQGAQVIHVGNTRVPSLEPDKRPASLSKAVMRDLLRDQLKFDGVVMVGPIDSPDVGELIDPQQAAVQAILSGADMILWNEMGPRVIKAMEKISVAVDAGVIGQETIDAACVRVITLKEKMGLRARPLPKPGDAEKIEKNKSYPKEAYEIERHAITLVKNTGNVLPLNKGASVPIGVTGMVGVEVFKNALEKYIKPISMQPIGSAKYVGDIERFEIDRLVRTGTGLRTTICIFANAVRTRGEVDLIRALKAKGTNVVVVLFGYPDSLPDLVDADAIVVAYCEGRLVNESLKAAAEALVGEGAIGALPSVPDIAVKTGTPQKFNAFCVVRSPAGTLPVTIDAPFVAGFGLSYGASRAMEKAEWDFGDGTRAKGIEAEHTYAEPGNYDVTLTGKDRKGETVERTFKAAVE
ncbi:MAG: PKD domain-containing protein [Candidatus Hydrogenedentes bacterium]|nr:PKD domain-containing protein [Candidatus Hydrogenedentota bacterium]